VKLKTLPQAKEFASMKALRGKPSSTGRHCRGFTLVELMVASSLAALVAGTTMTLLIETAKENKRGVADSTVELVSSGLESKLLQSLRVMSAKEVVFASPQSIIVACGPSPDNPRQKFSFDSSTGSVLYQSDLSSTNASTVLAQTTSHGAVRDVNFSPSLKPDGTADYSLVNVLIKMDDNGSAGRSGSSGSNNPAVVWRSFAVKMRNN
jgi:prepilin-type N-terminal cleavage/methylation domain-containing protein